MPHQDAPVAAPHCQSGRATKHAIKQVDRLMSNAGISATRVGDPMRRDRLLLVSAFAMALLTQLGEVGERLGMDRLLKSNTSRTRTHSLFRQGCMLYELIPTMPEHRLGPLIAAFAQALDRAGEFSGLFAQAK